MGPLLARPMVPSDVVACGPLLQRGWVHPALAQAAVLTDWLRRGRLVAHVFEEVRGAGRPGRLRGCGLSIPVPWALARRAMAGEVSPLVDTIVRQHATLALDRRAQAQALAQHSLCMAVAGFALDDCGGDVLDEVNAVAQAAFVQAHSGYGLRCVLGEVWPDHPQAQAYRSSMLAMGCHVAPARSGAATEVLYLTDSDLARAPFHPLFALFRHRPRRWGFTPAQQSLLEMALAGLDDQQAAQVLGLSLHTIRKRWRAIYAALEADPQAWSLLGLPQPWTVGSGGRGAEKRHRLLEYVRTHPEELRPWPAPGCCMDDQARFLGLGAHPPAA
jgi:DNA-binding CsgD family transcriptional regulator